MLLLEYDKEGPKFEAMPLKTIGLALNGEDGGVSG
jgi:hypothetical protein